MLSPGKINWLRQVKIRQPIRHRIIPEYAGSPYVELNNNIPDFQESEYTTEVFEQYSDLDALGRCQAAYANICQEIMPTQERGENRHDQAFWMAYSEI